MKEKISITIKDITVIMMTDGSIKLYTNGEYWLALVLTPEQVNELKKELDMIDIIAGQYPDDMRSEPEEDTDNDE